MTHRQAKVVPLGFLARGRFRLPRTVERELEIRSAANPSDLIGVFPLGADDLSEVLDSAVGARRAWQDLAPEARLELVAQIERPLQQRSAELAARLQRELGRPSWECQQELLGLTPRLQELISAGYVELADARHSKARDFSRPLGVVLVLGPAMLPLATSHDSIIAALIAGNTVVWKPSPLAAASAALYAEALLAAGLPPGVFNLIQGDDAVGERLLADRRVDAAVFTGHRDHALEVRLAASDRLDLTLILRAGTKNPAVVLEDANLDKAVSEIVRGAFLTAGQRCSAIGRVLVQASILERFAGALVAETRRASLGPMFSLARRDRFCSELAAAEADGARPLLSPELRRDSLVVSPSIHLVEDPRAARRYRERELFGPNLAVEPVGDLAGALERLGGGSLHAALFSEAPRHWQTFRHAVEAGAPVRNQAPAASSRSAGVARRAVASSTHFQPRTMRSTAVSR